MNIPSDTDVIIVGAGPTGLMLANQLVRHGVCPLIIDRNPGPSIHSKALGVQARTIEIYSHLGIAEHAIELGKKGMGANIWVEGKRAARLPLNDIGRQMSPYPFILILGQDDNEKLLGDLLRQRGVAIHWDTELVDLEQSSDRALATLKSSDGSTHKVEARWIAGCDGARSAVRTLNNIDFAGAAYEHVFFVSDTIVTGPMVANEVNVFLWRGGFHLFFAMRGDDHWRVVGIVPPELRGKEGLDLDAVLPSIQKEAGSALSFRSCNWFSTYRIHHRRAERFRDRRCFLLGDAAHVHSPVGAQGMNTGLQDAYNLAWKLALVVSGRAGEELLDSYALERIPVAERLLRTTDQAFQIVVSENWLAGLLRLRVFSRVVAFAMGRERLRKFVFRTISQTGICYQKSPLSETLAGVRGGGVRAGDRFPWLKLKFSTDGVIEDLFARLDDTRFNLIVIGQPFLPASVTNLGGLLLVHNIPNDLHNDDELSRAGIPKPSFYLLRPDGHVGLMGGGLDGEALDRYVMERLAILPRQSG